MRIVVGLSGGVDSSVAALLLKKQGHEVIGLFMKNWHDESVTKNHQCPWVDDSTDAMIVAQQLDIPFQVVDFSHEYKTHIVDYMIEEYKRGRTPNPDILCNRVIKFDVLLQEAIKLQADKLATGHYAWVQPDKPIKNAHYRLMSATDTSKDQSYFLSQLTQYQLSKSIFPLGQITKTEVRSMASTAGLITAQKKDSQGLCFVGKIRLPQFLEKQLESKEGDIVLIPPQASIFQKSHDDLDQQTAPYTFTPGLGSVIGKHTGAHFYTIGQRKGLCVGGVPLPLFVLATDVRSNILYVGMGKDHPGLFRMGLFIDKKDVHWIRQDKKLDVNEMAYYKIRIRYRQSLQESTLYQKAEGLYIIFAKPQRSITPGQFATWYDEVGELIGSGIISQ